MKESFIKKVMEAIENRQLTKTAKHVGDPGEPIAILNPHTNKSVEIKYKDGQMHTVYGRGNDIFVRKNNQFVPIGHNVNHKTSVAQQMLPPPAPPVKKQPQSKVPPPSGPKKEKKVAKQTATPEETATVVSDLKDLGITLPPDAQGKENKGKYKEVVRALSELPPDKMNDFFDKHADFFRASAGHGKLHFFPQRTEGDRRYKYENKASEPHVKKIIDTLHPKTALRLDKNMGQSAPTQAFKAVVSDIVKTNKHKLRGCVDGNPREVLGPLLHRITSREAVNKVHSMFDSMEELEHDGVLCPPVDTFFDDHDQYMKSWHGMISDIVRDTIDKHEGVYGKDFMPKELDKMRSIVNQIERYTTTTKDDTVTQLNNIGVMYAEMRNAIYGSQTTEPNPKNYRNQDEYDSDLRKYNTRDAMANAFVNNIGEILSTQAEVIEGELVALPTSGTAKLGDKIRLGTHTTVSRKPFVITGGLVSIKKSDGPSSATVGSIASGQGLMEGFVYDPALKEKVLNGVAASKELLAVMDQSGSIKKTGGGKYMMRCFYRDRGNGFLNTVCGDNKELHDEALKVIEVERNRPRGKPATSKESANLRKIAALLNTELEKIHSATSGSDKIRMDGLKHSILLSSGSNSQEFNNETRMFQRLKKEYPDYKQTIAQILTPGKGEDAQGKESIGRLLSYIESGDASKLDTKDVQLATMAHGISQNKGESFEYSITEMGKTDDGKDMLACKGHYGQVEGRTIHKVNGSYVMGFLASYSLQPLYTDTSKFYNVKKLSERRMKKIYESLKQAFPKVFN
jgi:hypothetical protein